MTKFTDQLFDDLMREHGPVLASTKVPAAPKRHLAARPVLLTAGAGGLAVAATVGTLVAGGGTPAYAVTTHPNGTVTLAVYQQSGIAEANARLHALGDRVVVVPVRSGCPSITSLPAPGVPARQISVEASGSTNGSVTVAAQGVPVGDILVMGVETGTGGQFSMKQTTSTVSGKTSASGSVKASGPAGGQTSAPVFGSSRLTSGPAPSCISIPAGSLPPSGKASCGHSPAPVGSLPASPQQGVRTAKPGGKASGSCHGSAGKAGTHVTPAEAGSATHGSN
jgi:hypothetical protein